MGTGLEIALIGATLFQGVSGFMQGNAMAKAETAQAAARQEQLETQNVREKARLVRQQRAEMGESIVAGAASGSGISTFSELYQDDLEQKAIDIATMNYNTNLEVSNTWYQANMRKSQHKAKGKAALVTSITSAAMMGMPAGEASNLAAADGSTWMSQADKNSIVWSG